ncbi:ribonuclease P protein component [bacterium]|nr:ribonuclease P protein component [bacterium]
MLRKNERLKRGEFNRFFSLGHRYHSPTTTLIFAPEKKRKVAVVVSKKVAKLAVQRNKIRRRVYALARDYSTHGVYIFIIKPNAAKVSYNDLKEDIIKLIEIVNRKT